ncbi:MAG TPA: nucleotidyltransferase domain-containing protein [Candidatus Ratteibacteria bacterium]|nr:nucleotidyltransferase domain-containing protein [Candidatus Ratteibacteria bacterium]
MAFKTDKIIKETKKLIKAIEKRGLPIKRAYIFGSYTKGTAKKWSDIDILLVSDKFKGIRFYDVEKLISLTKGSNNFIEFHPLKTSDFVQEDLFIKEIIETGIRIK